MKARLAQCSVLVLMITALGCSNDDADSLQEDHTWESVDRSLNHFHFPSNQLEQALKRQNIPAHDAHAMTAQLKTFVSGFDQSVPQAPGITTVTSQHQALEGSVRAKLTASGGVSSFELPESLDFASVPQDPNNPVDVWRVTLGALLFHETGIGVRAKNPAGNQSYSCASCHSADAGFQANRRQGIGDGGVGFDPLQVRPLRQLRRRRAAHPLAVVHEHGLPGADALERQFGATGDNVSTFPQWVQSTPPERNNLGFQGLETQAIAGQGVHRQHIEFSMLKATPMYRALFELAFPHAADRMTTINAGLAIAAYERVTLANQAPWQRWLKGERMALTTAQLRGADVFFGDANCVSCHTGPALNSMSFHGLAMGDLEGPDLLGSTLRNPDRRGRGGFTARAADQYKFKVPQLYNLVDSPFYGHGATFTTVRQVVDYKDAAVPQNLDVPFFQRSPQFVPLNLSVQQREDLTLFLEGALRDPNLARFEPSALPSGLCVINNDLDSRVDRNCGPTYQY